MRPIPICRELQAECAVLFYDLHKKILFYMYAMFFVI